MAKGSIQYGVWAFTIGMFLALFAGLFSSLLNLPNNVNGIIVAVLVVLGIAVGFLNVSKEETSSFLMSSVAVMIALFTAGSAIAAMLSSLGIIGTVLQSLLSYINMFVFPATIVVAIKSIYALAKD
jgi:cytochrome bd-type quinol oxidase subunit 2